MAQWNQLIFQDPANLHMKILFNFHDFLIMMMILVITTVSYMIIALCMNKYHYRYLYSAHIIELVWTIIPGLILVSLAAPSMKILYMLDETSSPALSLKIIGHQWYWSYEYSDFNLTLDSFMIPTDSLPIGAYRLLETDNHIMAPMNTMIRLLITSSDVIHAWTIPSICSKVDAVPGRINQLNMNIAYPGLFFGQCSEICGANHSFMPISMEVMPLNTFISWLNSK